MSARLATLVLLALLCSPAVQAQPRPFVIDPVHTQVWFRVSHLGFSTPRGRFARVTGRLELDPADWASSEARVEIDARSVDLGDEDWNRKVAGDDFLDADTHPTLTFVSERVEILAPDQLRVHGRLRLRGIERPIVLAVRVNRVGRHSYSLKYVAGFSATAALRRSDFGMRRLLPAVGDEVAIELEVEAIREGKAR